MLQKRFVLTVSLIAMFAVGMAHADIASVEYVEKGLSTKQETISDLSSIRSGAKAGNTAVQPGSLAAVATSGSYNDLSNKPTIPTVNNATLTIQRNGTDVGTFTANASGNKTINITDKDTTYTAGTNITITDGVISAKDTVYTLPTASSSTKGGVKIGSNVNVSSDGTISVAAPYNDTSIRASIKAVDDKVGDSSVADQIDAVRATTIAGLTEEEKTAMLPTVKLTEEMIATSTNEIGGMVADNAAAIAAIPTVNNATLTIQRNGTEVGTFTANASGNKTINITDNDTVYTLPTASSSTKGGVKIGSNVNVSSDGTISVASGTPSQLGVVKVGTIPSGSATSTTYATIWVE